MRSVLAYAAFGGFARLFKKGPEGEGGWVGSTRSKHHFVRSTICFQSISCVQLCPMFLDISGFPCSIGGSTMRVGGGKFLKKITGRSTI